MKCRFNTEGCPLSHAGAYGPGEAECVSPFVDVVVLRNNGTQYEGEVRRVPNGGVPSVFRFDGVIYVWSPVRQPDDRTTYVEATLGEFEPGGFDRRPSPAGGAGSGKVRRI